MLTMLCGIMAALSFIGFAAQAILRNGHGMVYAAVMCGVWTAAACWAAGAFTP